MPAGIPAALLIGGGIGSAASSVMAGNQQAKSIKAQGEYTAQVYEQQATMVKEQQKVANYQFNRNAARARGAIVAATGGKGFNLSGSPLAIMVDNETQMQFDNAIENYNFDIESGYARSAAGYSRQTAANQAAFARASGYSNAFSTLLNTGVGAYQMNAASKIAATKRQIGAINPARVGQI